MPPSQDPQLFKVVIHQQVTLHLVTCRLLDHALPGCAEAGAPPGVLAQGLVSRAGRAGGRTGGLEVTAAEADAAAVTEKAGAVPFTTADKRAGAGRCVRQLDVHNVIIQLMNSSNKMLIFE